MLGHWCPKVPRPPGSSLRPGSFAGVFEERCWLAKQVYLLNIYIYCICNLHRYIYIYIHIYSIFIYSI